jgi:hypothetical protein
VQGGAAGRGKERERREKASVRAEREEMGGKKEAVLAKKIKKIAAVGPSVSVLVLWARAV